jgi:organic radical activating enzyme
MWEQMQEHIPHLERIYFAGGEPLIMEEHYRLLNELVKRKMFHVNLVYNSNFSKLAYKDQNVLEIWKHFMQGQESIITRVQHYNDICNDMVENQKPSIPEYFDNVDYGIMCGMIYCSTNRDLLNLSSDTWI